MLRRRFFDNILIWLSSRRTKEELFRARKKAKSSSLYASSDDWSSHLRCIWPGLFPPKFSNIGDSVQKIVVNDWCPKCDIELLRRLKITSTIYYSVFGLLGAVTWCSYPDCPTFSWDLKLFATISSTKFALDVIASTAWGYSNILMNIPNFRLSGQAGFPKTPFLYRWSLHVVD